MAMETAMPPHCRSCRTGDKLTLDRSQSKSAFHQTTGAFLRGVTGERTGSQRNRQTFNLRADCHDAQDSHLCRVAESPSGTDRSGQDGEHAAGESNSRISSRCSLPRRWRMNWIASRKAKLPGRVRSRISTLRSQSVLKDVEDNQQEIKESTQKVSDVVCDKCGKQMVEKWGRNGRFLACSGYPECKSTQPLNGKEDQTTDEKCELVRIADGDQAGALRQVHRLFGISRVQEYEIAFDWI